MTGKGPAMAITVKDIAARLGISYSTVAYALSGKGTINEETRKRVCQAAREMGYIPNQVARSFRGKRCRMAGVIVPNLTSGYNEVIQDLFFCGEQAGWDIQTAVSQHIAKTEERHLRRFMEMRVDAILLRTQFERWADLPEDNPLRLAATNGLPLVVWGGNLRGAPFPAIRPDVDAQFSLLLGYLRQKGYSAPALATTESGALSLATQEEIELFGKHCAALWGAESGTVLHPQFSKATGELLRDKKIRHDSLFSLAPGKSILEQALALPRRPRVIVCRGEMLALGVLHEAQVLGIRVPQDLALCALTRNLTAQCSPVPLTTADFPPARVAQAAMDLITHLCAPHRKEPHPAPAAQTVLIAPELIAGDSA